MKVIWRGESDPLFLLSGKTYESEGEAWDGTMLSVIDETGEAYLYPKEDFEIVEE